MAWFLNVHHVKNSQIKKQKKSYFVSHVSQFGVLPWVPRILTSLESFTEVQDQQVTLAQRWKKTLNQLQTAHLEDSKQELKS